MQHALQSVRVLFIKIFTSMRLPVPLPGHRSTSVHFQITESSMLSTVANPQSTMISILSPTASLTAVLLHPTSRKAVFLSVLRFSRRLRLYRDPFKYHIIPALGLIFVPGEGPVITKDDRTGTIFVLRLQTLDFSVLVISNN